jgi:sterol desaturase/sphingolipid hydroxylase (fatty acid hydroxylase superfamily)
MDTNDYYALLGPFLVLLMLLEAWIGRRQGLRIHHLPDTLANLATGAGQVLIGVFTGAFILSTYDGFQQAFALLRWSEGSPAPWVLAFVGVDFCYYWFHRASHAVAALWALHVVHHQSSEMNLSVAMRQTYFSDFTAMLFFWPLPLLGVPKGHFFFAVGCLSLYEALLHNRIIHRTGGPWGLLFNTPSFHRLHHACDARYRDHNFGSTLIVWDRLFGTFVPHTEPPTYGTVEPFRSHNPVWAQIAPVLDLLRRARRAPSLRGALSVLLCPPGWIAPWEESRPDPLPPRPARIPVAQAVAIYAILQAIGLAVTAQLFLRIADGVGLPEAAGSVALILMGTITVSGLLERKAWSLPVEAARLVLSAAWYTFVLSRSLGGGKAAVAAVWAALSMGALVALRGTLGRRTEVVA